MTQTTTDPYRMPTGLALPEQRWWTAMVAEIREHKRKATKLSLLGEKDQRTAQRARDDFARLRQEYRDRHYKQPQWAVDIKFMGLAVAKDCISDDQWYSRQATEKYTAATFHWEKATDLGAELHRFLRRRTDELLASRQRHPGQVPTPREGA